MLRDEWFLELDSIDSVLAALHQLGVSAKHTSDLGSDFRFEHLRLPFYEHFSLVRLRCDWPPPSRREKSHDASNVPGEFRLETYLMVPDNDNQPLRPLDTTSLPIHALNAEAPIQFDAGAVHALTSPDAPWRDEKQTVDDAADLNPVDLYLRFFCHMVWSSEGPFSIVNRRSDLFTPARPSPMNASVDISDNEERPVALLNVVYGPRPHLDHDIRSALDAEKQRQGVAYYVRYGDLLYQTAFAVNTKQSATARTGSPESAGYVEMLADQPIGVIPGDVARFKKDSLFHPSLVWHAIGAERDIEDWTRSIPNEWFKRGPKSPRSRGATPAPEIERAIDVDAITFLREIATNRIVQNARVTAPVRLRGHEPTDADVDDAPTPDTATDDVVQHPVETDATTHRFNAATDGFGWCGEHAITSCAITIADVTFDDAVELEYVRFASSLSFTNCVFLGAFSLMGSTIRGDLTIDQCLAHPAGEHRFSLANAVVEGSVRIEDTQI